MFNSPQGHVFHKNGTNHIGKKSEQVFFRRRQMKSQTEVSSTTALDKHVNPKVINLSRKQLTEFEIKLLSKGLKCTPTPNDNKQELKTDLKEYTRKLRSTEYLYDPDNDESSNEQNDIVRHKFNPKKGRNMVLEIVCETLEKIYLLMHPVVNLEK